MTIRKRGLLYAVGGAALTVVAFALVNAGLDGLFGMLGGVFVFAPPAMVTVGIAMMLAPGEGGTGLDLADWLDGMPLRRRLLFYATGAVGLAIGALLLLILGDWSVSGVIDILL